MFKKSDKGYYFWEEFAEIDGIVHGFSTRKFGDMNIKNPRSKKSLKGFLKALGVNERYIVKMDQIHGNNVEVASSYSHKDMIGNSDGLLTQEKGIFLMGTFADCVPVLFFDKTLKIAAIAHAGWRGVYKEIIKVLVPKMIAKGSKASDLMVGIGPSIRECCYNIDKERETLFNKKFSKLKGIITKKNGKRFLNLQGIIKVQLDQLGVLQRNVLDCTICTKDNLLDFYSFREEHGRDSFGLSAAVIGKV